MYLSSEVPDLLSVCNFFYCSYIRGISFTVLLLLFFVTLFLCYTSKTPERLDLCRFSQGL